MLMRDALKLLEESYKELDKHDKEDQHITRKGLKEEIEIFITSIRPMKKS